jgi:hypothetical protein
MRPLAARTLYLFGLTLALFYLTAWSVAYVAAVPPPPLWLAGFPSRAIGLVVWMQIAHTCALAIAALPVAAILRGIYGAAAVRTALLVSCVVAAWSVAELIWVVWRVSGIVPDRLILIITVVDYLKLIATLPLLTWALRRMPSNFSWSGP